MGKHMKTMWYNKRTVKPTPVSDCSSGWFDESEIVVLDNEPEYTEADRAFLDGINKDIERGGKARYFAQLADFPGGEMF